MYGLFTPYFPVEKNLHAKAYDQKRIKLYLRCCYTIFYLLLQFQFEFENMYSFIVFVLLASVEAYRNKKIDNLTKDLKQSSPTNDENSFLEFTSTSKSYDDLEKNIIEDIQREKKILHLNLKK